MCGEWRRVPSLASSYPPLKAHAAKQGSLELSVSACELAQRVFKLKQSSKQPASDLISTITLSQSHQLHPDYVLSFAIQL